MAGRHLAAQPIVGREAAPAPLVLQLVVAVLGGRPLPVQVGHRQQLRGQIGHQHLILIPGCRTALGQPRPAQDGGGRRRGRRAFPQSPPHDHAPPPGPASQLQPALCAFPAVDRGLPAALLLQQLDQFPDALGVPHAEEIPLVPGFALGQQSFVPVAAVAAQQPRPAVGGQVGPGAQRLGRL